MEKELLKKMILEKVEEYYKEAFKKEFVPGSSYIQNSGKSFDEEELKFGVEAVLDGWWTEGRFSEKFCEEISNFLSVRYVSLVNSGSSANLIAIMTLTSHMLGERRIKNGDEIITVAAGFPTTINPIIQSGCIPVFIDIKLDTLTPNLEYLYDALSEKTKAVFIAHPLGNPFDIETAKKFCEENNLWLIEDSCDALGSIYNNNYVGSFGDISTLSFYPAHHITTGEGGAVVTNNPLLYRISKSIRDWGRDCWCPTGKDNTCQKRFSWKLGNLPYGYDHKFIYSHIGYNLKITDMQAAIGLAQIKKIKKFNEIRKNNFSELYEFFSKKYSNYFYLPSSEKNAEPSWFGFPLTVRKNAPFSRHDLITFLDSKKIGTRLLFAGNVTKQPYFTENEIKYRIIGSLENTDYSMENTFWIGVHQGITKEMLEYIKSSFSEFLDRFK